MTDGAKHLYLGMARPAAHHIALQFLGMPCLYREGKHKGYSRKAYPHKKRKSRELQELMNVAIPALGQRRKAFSVENAFLFLKGGYSMTWFAAI